MRGMVVRALRDMDDDRDAAWNDAADAGMHRLKAAFGAFATGVTVVTARLDGLLHGMTASAFCSVSLDPPLVLVCVEKSARMHDFILKSGAFAINILSGDQEDVSRHFARRDRPLGAGFDIVAHTVGRTGAPLLDGTCAYIECTLHHACDGGDHTIYVGLVQAVGGDGERRPLLYHRGRYLHWAPDGSVSAHLVD